MKDQIKRAILLLNMGGPDTLAAVRPFLYRLFSDPHILPIKNRILRHIVAHVISFTRSPFSKKMYRLIGGGSPIRSITEAQARLIELGLRQDGFNGAVRIGFSYSEPSILQSIQGLHSAGIEQILLVPLYPQYSQVTSGTALADAQGTAQRSDPRMKIAVIKRYPEFPLFIKAHASLIKDVLDKVNCTNKGDIHLLFLAHSIPLSLVEKKQDPYLFDVRSTVRSILGELKWGGRSSLAFQSKLGPVKWLEPSCEEELKKIISEGVRRVIIIPVSFVSDHVETLYEIDQVYVPLGRQLGLLEIFRTAALNTHPDFIQAMVELIKQEEEFWKS